MEKLEDKREQVAEASALNPALKAKIKASQDYRVKQEALWMEIDYFIEGNHLVYYNKQTREVQVMPYNSRSTFFRPVNLLRSQERNVANFINKNEPTVNIPASYKYGMDEQEKEKAKERALMQSSLCLHWYRRNRIRFVGKSVVRMGVRRGLSYAFLYWDEDKEDFCAKVHDPFEVLIDPSCGGEIQRASFIQTSSIVTKEWLENEKGEDGEPMFKNLDRIQSSDKSSSSVYRQAYLANKYSSLPKDQYILNEVWEKKCRYVKKQEERVEYEEGEMEMEGSVEYEKEKYVQRTYYIGDVVIGEKEYNWDKYPCVAYFPEDPMGEMYPRPWFADHIPLIKSLDNIHSMTEEYVAVCGQGRYIADEKTRITTSFNGKNGQIVKSSGGPITPLQPAVIPYQVIKGHKDDTERYMSEIGGIQSLNIDQALSSNTSGAAIRQLQAQQTESVGEPTDNYAKFMSDLFSLYLELASATYVNTRHIPANNNEYKVRGRGGVVDAVSSAEALEENGEIILDKADSVEVEIIPGSAYSDFMAQENALTLFDRKVLDKKTLLDAYKIGSTTEIIEAAEEEEAKQLKIQEEQKNLDMLRQQETKLQDQMMTQEPMPEMQPMV